MLWTRCILIACLALFLKLMFLKKVCMLKPCCGMYLYVIRAIQESKSILYTCILVLTGHHCKPHACVKCFLKGFVEWNKWWEPCTEVGFRLHGSTNWKLVVHQSSLKDYSRMCGCTLVHASRSLLLFQVRSWALGLSFEALTVGRFTHTITMLCNDT